MIERNVHTTADELSLTLAGRAHVDDERRVGAGQMLGGQWRTDAFGGRGQIRTRREAQQSIREVSDDVVEADPPKTDGGLMLASRVRDDHDRPVTIQHGASPRRVLTAKTDVDAAGEVCRCKLAGIAYVENLTARPLQGE